MSPIILTLIILALALWGLERNHARHQHLRSGPAGSIDAEDRDRNRVRAELRAVGDRQARSPVRPSRPDPDAWHRVRAGTSETCS